MKHVRLVLALLSLVGAATVAGGFYWVLPKTEKVHISGTEVKRLEGTTTRDVRYIQGAVLGSGEPVVFRNEDTRWGFPWYLKFNAADLSARAAEIARETPSTVVLVTYYGVRSRLFDWYPNALRLEIVQEDDVHIPIFNIVFLTLFFGGGAFLYSRLRRGLSRLGNRLKRQEKTEKTLASPKDDL